MDQEDLLQKALPHIKTYWLPLSLALVGLMFLGYGLIYSLTPSGSQDDIVFESANESKSAPEQTSQQTILVDLEGAVVNSGMHRLSFDGRIQDALIKAGGLSQEADRDWVAKNINLAAKISDGAKIYIPKIGDKTIDTSGLQGGIIGSAQNQLNINTASVGELDRLPGIGPVLAQKILDSRPYSSIDDLISKKVISSSVFKKIKEKITAF